MVEGKVIRKVLKLLCYGHINREQALDELTLPMSTVPELKDFKRMRRHLNYSMDDVAKFAGVSKSAVWRMEQGKDVLYNTAKKILDFYIKENNELY